MTNQLVPNRLTNPIYNFAEADHLAAATAGTTKRWVRGYHYSRRGLRIDQPPVTPRQEHEMGAASFLDLLEVVVISRLKAVGFTLGDVRSFVANIQELLKLPRPLVQVRFKTDGKEIFVYRGSVLLEIGRRKGEMAWTDILEPFLEELRYTPDGWADRWWPLGQEAPIIVDPDYGFGLPVILGSGVRTEIVMERVRAGDLPDEIAHDFNITSLEVHRAIQYEAKRLES